MDLMGKKVNHKVYGEGSVIAQCENRISIEFASKTSKFLYPDAFSGKMQIADTALQAAILIEIKKTKAAQRKKRAETEHQDMLKALEEAVLKAASKNKREAKPRLRRIPGKPFTFYAFQKDNFELESQGGYIWAPLKNEKGKVLHHFQRLVDVRAGDIILHGKDKAVVAISLAKDKFTDSERPGVEVIENEWENTGRRVECEYIILKNPIKTEDFKDDIIKLSTAMYSPFNKNARGNSGYLFDLNPELAGIFIKESAKENPDILKQDYIKEFLK